MPQRLNIYLRLFYKSVVFLFPPFTKVTCKGNAPMNLIEFVCHVVERSDGLPKTRHDYILFSHLWLKTEFVMHTNCAFRKPWRGLDRLRNSCYMT